MIHLSWHLKKRNGQLQNLCRIMEQLEQPRMEGRIDAMNRDHWIEGKVSIPHEKREEFNENVLKLFRLCGIRKIKGMEIGGQIITVVGEPEQDNKGIVRFDYSIFEERKRQVSTYDMNTCELFAADCGYGEFSLVMNLVMAMQEAYSAGECYFMRKNQVCDVYGYALLIERTIGLKLSFPGRERIWNMFAFFKSSGKYELPACILAAYGWAANEDFWKIWDSLEITGYHDIYSTGTSSHVSSKKEVRQYRQEREQESGREPLFYQVILRENEDEFLEFWDDHELYLSDAMKRNLAEWKQEYENIGEAEAEEVDTEGYLAEILREMQEIWWCRYADEKMVQEFIAHSGHLQFQKALLVFRKMMDRDLEYFPELTARQVREWVTRRCGSERDRIKISGYASLLANPTGRCKVLGF